MVAELAGNRDLPNRERRESGDEFGGEADPDIISIE